MGDKLGSVAVYYITATLSLFIIQFSMQIVFLSWTADFERPQLVCTAFQCV